MHPIITHGGSQVNVIPADVRIETYVRGKTVEAILDANVRVDRALKAGALALGAQVEIETLPGYLPLFNHEGMAKYFLANASAQLGADSVTQLGHRSGSTDMGDISHVMPTLHPYIGGASGTTLPVPMMNLINGGAHADNRSSSSAAMSMFDDTLCTSS